MAQQTLNDLELGLSFRTKLNDNFTDLYTNKLDSSAYTAADVLAKLLTVDGAGSGVDADTIDGLDSTAFATSAQGALADSALQDGDTVSELTVTDFAANQITLSELNNSYPGLVVVDNIRYDTTKDSNPVWTEKTGSLSYGTEAVPSGRYLGQFSTFASVVAAGGVVGDWYYNPSNMTFREVTSIDPDVSTEIFRAGSATFPKQVVIVAEASRLIIFDATKDQLEMWAVEVYTGLSLRAIASIEGKIAIATSTGLVVSDYVTPDLGSTTHDYTTSTTPAIINNSVNDVAMTVLDSAPIDPITRLRVPTIAVATDGGVSVIKDDGTVVNGTDTITIVSCCFTGLNHLITTRTGYTSTYYTEYTTASFTGTQYTGITDPFIGPLTGNTSTDVVPYQESFAKGHGEGISLVQANIADKTKGMSAQISSSYNTGWMQGDIKLAALCDTETGNITGGTTADRSGNGNDLTINGTLSRAVIGNGELAAWSGFSASNYLEMPYSSDFDFGTGDFYAKIWAYDDGDVSASSVYLNWAADASNNNRWSLFKDPADTIGFFQRDTVGTTTTTPTAVTTNLHQIVLVRTATDVLIYVNGQLSTSASVSAHDISNASGVLRVGIGKSLVNPSDQSSLLLPQVGAGAPSADQIAKMYHDELAMINGMATLDGTSDSVLALSYDKPHDLLHVATSYGRSSFRGLERVESEATTVGTPSAIYGEDGVLLQGGSTGFSSVLPEVNVRSDIKHPVAYDAVLPDDIYYTAAGGETDIYLGKGFTAKRVWKNAAPQKKKQGATANDFSIQFNGFEYFIRFASALTASDDIIIERVRV